MLIHACALYVPHHDIPLKAILPGGKFNGGWFRAPTWFEFDAGDGSVRLNLHPPDLVEHLQGFRRYVAQASGREAARIEVLRRIEATRACIGVVPSQPISSDSPTFAALISLIERFDGFMFVLNSVLLPDGQFLVGPMAGDDDDAVAEPPLREIDPEAFRHQRPEGGCDPACVAQREQHYRQLAERGFLCARWLPLSRGDRASGQLRPAEDIAARLLSLNALILWVCASEEVASSERLRTFVERNDLRENLAEGEVELFDLTREKASADHADNVGWRLENMWALSWMFGFEPEPPFFRGQVPQDVIDRMLFEFLPALDATVADFVFAYALRPFEEIARLEDLYYCAHNAVRNAQTGRNTLPPEFHPVRDGGAVHERRHALTWALSPGVKWCDTDLST